MLWPDDFINQIICGDCLEVMKDMPDKSIDMVLCDLPYGTTACGWDCEIDLEELWAMYRKVLKPRGITILTSQQPFTWKLCSSNHEWFRYELIWEKPNATNPFVARYQPLKCHENLLVFYGKSGTYNPQMTEGKPYRWKSQRSKGEAAGLTTGKNDAIDNEGTRYPRSVLRFSQERGLHPTQKPVSLFEYLIKTYTNEGDLVLDNCIGSGTTALACENTGRDYIGIDISEEYCKITEERLGSA